MNDIDIELINCTIDALKEHIHDTSIDPLILTLEALKQDPNSESLLKKFSDTFFNLGIIQGAILTYAPNINILLSGDIFGDDRE